MIITPREAVERSFDLCVIGAGPAGISLTLEFARLKPEASVLLVEFGQPGMGQRNVLDDSIKVLNTTNHHEAYECTNKGFGGTSATWGGRCVMYDRIDFLPRPVIGAECTWDEGLFDEVKSFVPDASRLMECGTGPFDLRERDAGVPGSIAEGFVCGEVTDTIVERWSMPTRFGRRYKTEVEASPNIALLQGYRARHLHMDRANEAVSSIDLIADDGSEVLKVRATRFVIAAGALESTRLLLQNKQVFESTGGMPDALGRYYQSHLSGKIASVRFKGAPGKTDYGFIREADGTYIRRRFQFPAEVLLRENLLNTAIWLDNPLYVDPDHRSGAMSFMYLAMITPWLGARLAPPAIANTITKGKVYRVPSHIANVLKGLPGSLWTPASIFFRRYCLKRKLPGVFLYSPENKYALHFHSEQLPCRGNRIELGPDSESVVVHYNFEPEDIESVIRCHKLLDNWLRKCSCGQLEYWFPQERLAEEICRMSKDGIHQSGTTRIAGSPSEGVVDRDLKVFGTSNLFVCSSSAFPTSGQANPTFLTCVFAARLAKKLANYETG